MIDLSALSIALFLFSLWPAAWLLGQSKSHHTNRVKNMSPIITLPKEAPFSAQYSVTVSMDHFKAIDFGHCRSVHLEVDDSDSPQQGTPIGILHADDPDLVLYGRISFFYKANDELVACFDIEREEASFYVSATQYDSLSYFADEVIEGSAPYNEDEATYLRGVISTCKSAAEEIKKVLSEISTIF